MLHLRFDPPPPPDTSDTADCTGPRTGAAVGASGADGADPDVDAGVLPGAAAGVDPGVAAGVDASVGAAIVRAAAEAVRRAVCSSDPDADSRAPGAFTGLDRAAVGAGTSDDDDDSPADAFARRRWQSPLDLPPRPGPARLVAVLLFALVVASLPGAIRAAAPSEPPSHDVRAARIDVNHAPPDELTALPGVGPALAARIVAERTRARFRAPDDLRRVPGVGPVLLERITPHVVFGPAPDGH